MGEAEADFWQQEFQRVKERTAQLDTAAMEFDFDTAQQQLQGGVDPSAAASTFWDRRDAEAVAAQITACLEEDDNLSNAVAKTQLRQDFDDPYCTYLPQTYDYDVMLRAFLYAELRGFRHRQDLAEFLDDHPSTALDLGFEFEGGTLEVKTPHQTVVNECWNDRFTDETREYISEIVTHVREWSRENRTLIEASELVVPEKEDDEDDDLTKDEIRRITNEVMRHICDDVGFDRDHTAVHRDNVFLEVLAHCAFSNSSVYGGGDTFEWMQFRDEAPPSGKTFHDHIKALSPGEQLMMFDQAVESQIESVQNMGLYDKPLPIAIDTTTWESDAFGKRVSFKSIAKPDYHKWGKPKKHETKKAIEKWDLQPLVGEDPEDIRNANFSDPEKKAAAERIPPVVRYVHGTKPDDGSDKPNYAWEFAGAVIAHPVCPMFIGMKPLERRDRLEDHVEEFVERAQELVTVKEVYMDAAYAQSEVFNLFHYGNQFRTRDTFNMPYVMNIREDDSVKKAVLDEKPGRGDFVTKWEDNDKDVTVIQNYTQGQGYQQTSGTTTLVGLPKRAQDGDGEREVDDPRDDRVAFCTNRTDIDATNAKTLLRGPDPEMCRSEEAKRRARLDRGYGNRWMVETGFQKVNDFLAFTKSGHPGVRLFYMLYATLLFNCWRIVDRTIKKRKSIEYDDAPELKADTFSVIVANFLKPVT